jgi:DMSO/TMAO reductase YedYZ heme-binding membrane subunit
MNEGSVETPPPPPSGAGADVITPDKGKDPILILVLALFLGPVAYFVYGQWQKGLAAVGAWIVMLALAVATCGIGGFLFLPLAIAVVVDAYMQATLLKEGRSLGQWTFFKNHV